MSKTTPKTRRIGRLEDVDPLELCKRLKEFVAKHRRANAARLANAGGRPVVRTKHETGRCWFEGPVIRENATEYVYAVHGLNKPFELACCMYVKSVPKRWVQANGTVHIEPCPNCIDHPARVGS